MSRMILSVGMPRAGSGWYYNLTQDLVKANGGTSGREIRAKYPLKELLTEVNCNLGTLSFYRLVPVLLPSIIEPQYVIKLHAERRPLADLLIAAGWIRPTYIYRDPRDALLSAYEYGRRMREKDLTNAFTPLTSIEEAIDFMAGYVRIAEGWLSSRKTLPVRYENLLGSYDREVERLVDFLQLELSDDEISPIADQYRPRQNHYQQQGMHFVHGKTGRYREHLNAQQLARCDEKFGSFLRKYGYPES